MTVRERVLALLERRPDITHAHLVTAVPALSQATAHQFISGRGAQTPETERAFTRAIEQIERGDILRLSERAPIHITEEQPVRPRATKSRDFYVIETARRIEQVLNYCAEKSVLGIVTADYGVGKTESIKHWRNGDGRKTAHLYFEFDDFTARNVLDFLGAMCELLGLSMPVSTYNGGRVMRAVCAALEQKPMLLIFDQSEMTKPRILQIIRQIWDRTRHVGVGVAITGSPLLREHLNKRAMRDLGALSSRVAIWAALGGIQKAEARSILHKEGVRDISDAAFDLLYRASAGSMRRLMAVADMLVSKHSGKPITEHTIAGVAGNLWGLDLHTGPRMTSVKESAA